MNEKETGDLATLTQEQTEKWIGEVEDKAWLAGAAAFAGRFVLGNLLAELHDAGVVNAPAFIGRLQVGLASGTHTLNQQQRLGLEGLFEDLKLFFAEPKDSPGAGNPGGMFH